MEKPISPEIFEKVKDFLKDNPLVENVKIRDKEPSMIEVWLVKNEDTVSGYGGDTGYKLRKELDEFLHKEFDKEVGAFDCLYNWDAYLSAEKKYKEEHPEPKDPRYESGWKKRSYYDRTKGKGSKEVEAYKNEKIKWLADFNKAMPPRAFPGFAFRVEPAGTAAKIFDFYKDTKYFGD